GDVAESESEPAFAIGNEVVKVSAEFTGGSVAGSEVDARDFAGAGGKQLTLDFAGSVQVAEQPLLVFARLLIEAAVFEVDGDVGAEGSEQALVLGGKRVSLGACEVENADEGVAEEKR